MARRTRYCVAMSLDGYISGPNDEADWIVIDSEIDFAELWGQFDTLLMGRRTYEAAIARLGTTAILAKRVVVASRTLRPEDHAGITIVAEFTKLQMEKLRQQGGNDIWIMGGGELFRVLLAMKEVDSVEVSLVPVLLGGGTPLLPPVDLRVALRLTQHRIYPSGIVSLSYEVQQ